MLNDCLRKIHEWSEQWLVKFNTEKTESLLVSRKINKPRHPTLFMNNVPVSEVKHHKHIGLFLSHDGTEHINYMIKKTSNKLAILRRFRFKIDRNSLQTLYFSFIRPILEYGDIVWDNLTIQQCQSLENIQLEAARIITGGTKLTSHAKLYEETGWDTLQYRRKVKKTVQVHKMIFDLTPPYLSNLLPQRRMDVHQYNTRDADNLNNVFCKTNFYKNSFLPSSIDLWNSLPPDIKNSPSLSNLKKYLHRHSPTVPPYYSYGKRSDQVHHARLRMNCSSLNAHLFSRNLIDSPVCSCRQAYETTEHFLLSCPNYTIVRNECFVDLPIDYTFDMLLYGNPNLSITENENIFHCIQLYILKTKRFLN
ncbi:uncharacterized protein LOC117335784 [Pecten maximus]|uniref:uncharacterized protein LOC117335784 n=1 Tax=Pecten maximus TaxID=6579 RepID=UPI0014586C3C|nr:uncharacterized protein LOC117335784 [Pecten maximus]